MSTVPAAVTPTATAPLQAHYDPLSGDERRNNADWIRRNTGAWAPHNGDGGAGPVQEIDPRYRERSYSFRDVLESFNPIQHLPVVGQLYRDATGTQLHPIARVLVGAATGPLGVASAFANVALENATGRDLGGHVLDAVAPRQRDPNGPQLAGGSWIYDPERASGSTSAPAGVDPAANMAAAPGAPAADGQAAQRNPRRRTQQVAPPPPLPAVPQAEAAVPTGQSAPGAMIPREALAPAAGGRTAANGGQGQAQLQPGAAVAQALNIQNPQNVQGRNIQQYFSLAGTRPPSPESARPVPMAPPVGSGAAPRSAQPSGGPAGAAAQPARTATAAVSDGNDRTWFTAAMLHGVDRYRDARRTQDNEAPTVDLSE